MTKRLMSWAENTDKLLTGQAGLRNRVWSGLLYELLHMNAPALLHRWIPSFLRDRTVKVRILGHTKEIAINYGIPHGCNVCPLLFLLYMSKLPMLLPNTRRSLFTDDFMIHSESSITRSDLIQSNLQTSMDDLALLNSNHRIILRYTKSVRVLFERRKSNRLKPQGVTGRSSLLRHLLSSLVSPLTLLSPSNLTSILSPLLPIVAPKIQLYLLFNLWPSTSTLIRLYKSHIHSMFDYGVPATCVASPHIQLSWERIQTRFISREIKYIELEFK